MNDKEFEKLAAKMEEDASAVPVVERFLFEQERRHRAQPLNPLQRQNAARQKNALLDSPTPWYMRGGMGAFAERKQAKAEGK